MTPVSYGLDWYVYNALNHIQEWMWRVYDGHKWELKNATSSIRDNKDLFITVRWSLQYKESQLEN